jgi:acetyl esterase/lipase
MNKVISFFVCALLFQSCNKTKDTDSSWIKNKYFDIPYATKSEVQKLDIYLPENINQKTPVIIAIHGGAFMFGDKKDGQITPMLEGVKRGYAVIGVNYRLSDESKFPSQINDIKAAIRWVKANAKKYNFDVNKIILWGGSAGGNLASLAGTSPNVKELEDLTLGNDKFSCNVFAVIDWFGPINFLEMDKQFSISKKGEANHNEANSPESKLVGTKITLAENLVKKANPETYISADDPYFFIQHGTEDEHVPTQQSINFYNKLIEKLGKEKVSIELLHGAKHCGKQFETEENINKVFKFLDTIFKKP